MSKFTPPLYSCLDNESKINRHCEERSAAAVLWNDNYERNCHATEVARNDDKKCVRYFDTPLDVGQTVPDKRVGRVYQPNNCRHSNADLRIKKAFTLAEVLITLLIIGIISSLTIPVVMANHKKKEYALKLKKFHNMMVTAYENAERDFNIPFYWFRITATSASEAFKTYFANYIKYTKYEEISHDIVTVYLEDGTWFQLILLSSSNNFATRVTLDDMYVIYYDVNGTKGPNTNPSILMSPNGKDVYEFSSIWGIFNYDPTAPSSSPKKTIDLTTCNAALNDRADLLYLCEMKDYCNCTLLIENDGWEFKDDYPYKL